jgi:hypothetical protein
MSNWNKIPKITWGTSFANSASFGYPVDAWQSYSKPREGSETAQAQSGVEDSWRIGTDYYLSVQLRWIPGTNTTVPVATGWDGTTGIRAFTEWAQDKNIFRWYPDKDTSSYIPSYLVDPQIPSTEVDGTRNLTLIMRNTGSAYDGY